MVFEGFEIKLENCGNNDWVTDPIRPDNIMNEGSEDMYLKLDVAEQLKDDPNAPHLEMDFDYSGRDGLYEDDDSLIAIYDEADILKLAERLVRLLPNHELVLKAPEVEPKTVDLDDGLTKETAPDPERCNDDVYKHGVSLGFHDMTKDEAEAWCIEQTKVTGRKHDWHYVGGRVHIKAMPEVKGGEQ
jgi:hypothetical protein